MTKSTDISKTESAQSSKSPKKKKKKQTAVMHVSETNPIESKEQATSKQKRKNGKTSSKTPKDDESLQKAKRSKMKSNGKSENVSPDTKEAQNNHKHKKVRKKAFNKDAIEKMKARQLAKKEKQMRQSLPAAPPPDVKRRRPKLPVRLESVQLNFADDDTMMEFEGVWVPREETGRLQSAREQLERRGLPAEKVQRRMKQLVRREHRKLKLRLIAAQAKTERAAREREQFLQAQTPRVRRRLPGRACGLTLREDERLARFDGFWVSAEAVPRLEELRQKLAAEGRPESEARRLLRKARRREERQVKTAGRLVCAKCGSRGHLGSDCTAVAQLAAAGTACFRCGQPGHRLSDCPKKGQIAGLPFATCFLCKEQGHMSRECPQAAADGPPAAFTAATSAAATSGQSWRGLTHDTGSVGTAQPPPAPAPAPAPVPAPAQAKKQSKGKAHIRFD